MSAMTAQKYCNACGNPAPDAQVAECFRCGGIYTIMSPADRRAVIQRWITTPPEAREKSARRYESRQAPEPEPEPPITECPYCLVAVQPQASKCSHCGEWLSERSRREAAGERRDGVEPKGTRARFEHTVLSLQWHKGFMGIGRGFDQTMMSQVDHLGGQGFELVAALTQPDPTWFTLFFKRRAG